MKLFKVLGDVFGGLAWLIYQLIKLPIFITIETLYFVAAILITPLALITGSENVKSLWKGMPLIYETFYVNKQSPVVNPMLLVEPRQEILENPKSRQDVIDPELSGTSNGLYCANCGNQYTSEMEFLLKSQEPTYCEYCGLKIELSQLPESPDGTYA